jgi:hypothetical protein
MDVQIIRTNQGLAAAVNFLPGVFGLEAEIVALPDLVGVVLEVLVEEGNAVRHLAFVGKILEKDVILKANDHLAVAAEPVSSALNLKKRKEAMMMMMKRARLGMMRRERE